MVLSLKGCYGSGLKGSGLSFNFEMFSKVFESFESMKGLSERFKLMKQ